MKTNLSRRLLASVGALAVTLSLPAIQSLDPDHFSASAFARDGSDDGGGSDSRGDDGSGSGRGDDNDDDGGRGDDNSGRGGHDDSDDDDDDHGGRGGHDDDDDDGRDDDDDDDSGDPHGGRGDDNRPEVTLSVSEESLSGLLDGSLAAVDQLGRRLEVEIELEHGSRTVVAHPHRGDFTRNPGGITAVNIVSAAAR